LRLGISHTVFGRVDRKVPGLIGLNLRGEDVQPVTLRRTRGRVGLEKAEMSASMAR
jgi:hypothetical protein